MPNQPTTLTTEQRALLAERVMGWRQVDPDRRTMPGEFYIGETDLSTMPAVFARGSDALYSSLWTPGSDTPEGLWQARKALEKWWNASACRRVEIEYGPPAGNTITIYLIHDAEGGGRWVESAPTLALAICRALLAAIGEKDA